MNYNYVYCTSRGNDVENSYLLHMGKGLAHANGHYDSLKDLINTLSLVTQKLSVIVVAVLLCYKYLPLRLYWQRFSSLH